MDGKCREQTPGLEAAAVFSEGGIYCSKWGSAALLWPLYKLLEKKPFGVRVWICC